MVGPLSGPVVGQGLGKVARPINTHMIILYSDAPRGKRKRKEEEYGQTAAEGTSEVPNMEAPAGKRMKRAVNQPKRTTRGQKKASEPGQSSCLHTV